MEALTQTKWNQAPSEPDEAFLAQRKQGRLVTTESQVSSWTHVSEQTVSRADFESGLLTMRTGLLLELERLEVMLADLRKVAVGDGLNPQSSQPPKTPSNEYSIAPPQPPAQRESMLQRGITAVLRRQTLNPDRDVNGHMQHMNADMPLPREVCRQTLTQDRDVHGQTQPMNSDIPLPKEVCRTFSSMEAHAKKDERRDSITSNRSIQFTTADGSSAITVTAPQAVKHRSSLAPSHTLMPPMPVQQMARQESPGSDSSSVLDVEDKMAKKMAWKVQVEQDVKNQTGPSQQAKESRTWFQRFVSNATFEGFFACCILGSALVSGIEAQYAATHMTDETPLVFFLIQSSFTMLFLVELIMRVQAEGFRKFLCDRHNWNWAWLDVIVVVASVFDMLMDLSIMSGAFGEDTNFQNGSNMRIIKIVRITRLGRTFRLQRIIRFVVSLRTLVYSISLTLKSLFWAMVLLMMIMYVFAVSFTQHAVEYRTSLDADPEVAGLLHDYWGSLDRSMFTLFQTISGGISWRVAVIPLEKVSYVLGWLFTSYVAFVYFAVLNVVTGVFCSSAIETAQRNPDLIARAVVDNQRAYKQHLTNLFQSMDQDSSGKLTLAEFETLMHDEMSRAYFAALEIDFTDAWTIFKLIDSEGGGAIGINEFVDGCQSLRGGASSVQVANMNKELRNVTKKIGRWMAETTKHLGALENRFPVVPRSPRGSARLL